MQRLPPAQPSAEELAFRAREGSTPPNLQLAMAHAPEVARLQLELNRAVAAGMTIRQKELVILPIARATDNAYCWGHHVPPALGGGITDAEILSIREGDYSSFSERDQALIAFALAMVDRSVTDEIWAGVSAGRSPEEMVKLIMLAGFYVMLGSVQVAVDVPQDEGLGGFEQP